MDIVSEIREKFRDDISCQLTSDEEYRRAEKELHDYIQSVVPVDYQDNIERLIASFTAAVERKSSEAGIKIGAKIIAGLLDLENTEK